VRAMQLIAADVASGTLQPAGITEDVIRARLYTDNCPDPDLLIRTSGERRLSNFMLWQVAYAELYISNVLWPDFDRAALYEAILDFQRRDRRFGKVEK
jgi:undecaprenyl diphosphate synthase